MMSRALYKGLKIEWYPDECAAPIPRITEPIVASVIPQKSSVTMKQPRTTNSNLYSLLDLDDSEAEEDSEADNTTTSQALSGYPSNGVKINWADAAVVA
jgi:hypothetical protein